MVPALIKLVQDQSVDEVGLKVGAIHALWTLHGLGVVQLEQWDMLNNIIFPALKHPSAGVRRNAVQVLPADDNAVRAVMDAKLLTDPDPQVRLAAFLFLADMPPSEYPGILLAEVLLEDSEAIADRWQADAITSAAAVHAYEFLHALKALGPPSSGEWPPPPNAPLWGLVRRVAEHLARGKMPAKDVVKIINRTKDAPLPMAAAILDGLSAGWPRNHEVEIPKHDDEALVKLLAKLPPGSQGQLIRLGKSWGSRSLEEHADLILKSLLTVAADADAKEEARITSAQQAIELQPENREIADKILAVLGPQMSNDLAKGLLSALSASQADGLGEAILAKADTLTPAVRRRPCGCCCRGRRRRPTCWTPLRKTASRWPI